jgi:hypothetical protein
MDDGFEPATATPKFGQQKIDLEVVTQPVPPIVSQIKKKKKVKKKKKKVVKKVVKKAK